MSGKPPYPPPPPPPNISGRVGLPVPPPPSISSRPPPPPPSGVPPPPTAVPPPPSNFSIKLNKPPPLGVRPPPPPLAPPTAKLGSKPLDKNSKDTSSDDDSSSPSPPPPLSSSSASTLLKNNISSSSIDPKGQRKKFAVELKTNRMGPITLKSSLGSSNGPPLKKAKPSVFNDDESSEEEDMPPEARMRMKNIGRDTVTSSGPNSFGKTKEGFCDVKKLYEKQLKEALDKASDD